MLLWCCGGVFAFLCERLYGLLFESSVVHARAQFLINRNNGISTRRDWGSSLVHPRRRSQLFKSSVSMSFGSTRRAVRPAGWSSNKSHVDMDFGFDSCANVHYVGDKSVLSNYRPIHGISVEGLNGTANVVGVGTLRTRLATRNNGHVDIDIPDVFYIEDCEANILSSHKTSNFSPGSRLPWIEATG